MHSSHNVLQDGPINVRSYYNVLQNRLINLSIISKLIRPVHQSLAGERAY